MNVQFVDLYAQYKSIQSEIDFAISKVIQESAYIGGKYVSEFENKFALFNDVKHCISCANGTDSIEIILKAMNIGSGDEVIVPAISWISTSEAVSSVGAKPIFVDINPDFYTIDVNQIEQKITSKTKVIIPVHLYGHPCEMNVIVDLAKKYDLKVLEDCAQAHGAEWKGKKVGSFGDAASISFYPGKNLGAYGDAGAMLTNDDELAKMCRRIANHGQEGKHNHLIEGRNSRLDGLQAAILSTKLSHLRNWTLARKNIANEYEKRINSKKVILPKIQQNAYHVFHLYVIRTNKRQELINYLKDNGISTAIHYPTALPYLTCYEKFGFMERDYPVAYNYQHQILSIPMYAELDDEQINYICDMINSY